ncbi:RNA 3prime-terminal phosphate cyclase [Popillia japonica]|uniref:RNA 3prime-terminal phosphate cyclase n=1 Tax=Popillia japonica TaxID=7064 RepID=A0AAW1JYA3_POPJA
MPAISHKNNTLVYKGSSFLRQRLLLSVLSGKPVRIIDIRTSHDEPGIAEFEVNLIRLLDKVTNGTVIQLDSTGTNLYFQPGLLYGGEVDHECSLQRSIGYYLEVLVALGIFCKIPLKATLRGVTNNLIDPSVDHIKTSIIPVLKRFLIDDEGIDLKVTKRGMLPLGGGEVVFCCPVRKQLRPIQFEDSGMVKRIRGTAYTLRVSPAIANRINAKGITYSAEAVSKVIIGGAEPSIPEEVGKLAARRLCHEIYMGGCVDSAAQALAILCMALGQKDVTKLVTGSLSDYSISFLQHLREFFGITFKLEDYKSEEDSVVGADKILLTCIGIGYTNISKRTI